MSQNRKACQKLTSAGAVSGVAGVAVWGPVMIFGFCEKDRQAQAFMAGKLAMGAVRRGVDGLYIKVERAQIHPGGPIPRCRGQSCG
ncbi:hypothetical protein GCM10027292_02970 [Hydrogenophaga aquatica]